MTLTRSSATRLVAVMGEEIDRAMGGIRADGHPHPHYVSHLVRDEEIWSMQARYGALYRDQHRRRRNCFTDVRVGSYRSDQVREGGLWDNSKDDESYDYVDLPFGKSMDGFRHGLWRLTDAKYREAAESLLRKKAHELTYLDEHRHLPSFEKREASIDLAFRPLPPVDREAWARYIEKASATLKRYPEIKSSMVEFRARNTVRLFANSEGNRQIQCRPVWFLECSLWHLSASGDGLSWSLPYMTSDPSELPSLAELQRDIRLAVARLRKLSQAPTLRSYSGPVLLSAVPAGLLIHEALGHRLEGDRLLSPGEGQTFRDALGTRILPPFLSLRDDPSLERWEGRSLAGHYRYDDEGVESQPAYLVEGGTLNGFLTSRTGIKRRHRSNGHARSHYHERPISRMGVTIIESEDGLDDEALKAALIEEVQRQNLPFGIRILAASGGETATEAYNFQAFLGEIDLAAKVYPDGREEWIRGVDFVGTPVNAMRGILAAGCRHQLDNAYCGAESGFLPVSTISPALLLSHLELQSKSEAPFTQYFYPMPWE